MDKIFNVAYPLAANITTGSNLKTGEIHIPQLTPTGF